MSLITFSSFFSCIQPAHLDAIMIASNLFLDHSSVLYNGQTETTKSLSIGLVNIIIISVLPCYLSVLLSPEVPTYQPLLIRSNGTLSECDNGTGWGISYVRTVSSPSLESTPSLSLAHRKRVLLFLLYGSMAPEEEGLVTGYVIPRLTCK